MFSKDKSGNAAVCLKSYGLLSKGAVVPQSNELYADVEDWLAEGNSLLPFDGYPDTRAAEEIAAQIPALRYAEESKGVTINGIRYAGDESNRQALREAVDMATELGFTEFPTWKDSDGNYVANHPAADVKQALLAIGQRRSELIAKEGQFVAQALAGELTDLDGLDWS